MTRIAGVGAYAPRHRIDADAVRAGLGRFAASGVEATAVPDADEDALTMGWEAGRRALAAAGADAADVELLAFGTTTPPLAEEDLTSRLGAFLGVPERATRRYHLGSTRAGVDALLSAADADRTPALAVAADCPRGAPTDAVDHAAGAGAAAFVLATGGDAAVLDRASAGADYPGTRFREAADDRTRGLSVRSYDRAAATEVVADAVAELDEPVTGGGVDALALTAADGKRPYRVAAKLGFDAAEVVSPVADLGDLGAASAPVALALAHSQGIDRTLVVGWGSGASADAVVVGGTAPTACDLAREDGAFVDYATYLRLRGELTDGGPAGGGARVSTPSWRRRQEARYRLVGGRCADCGSVQFPGEGACDGCGSLGVWEPTRLARRGTVATATTVGPDGAPPEFVEQADRVGDFGVTVVEFPVAADDSEPGGEPEAERESDGDGPDPHDADASVAVPMQVTGPTRASVAAGDEVRAVVRRIHTQDGLARYGSKVTPAGEASDDPNV
ncbi:MAG: zinc ribbon domain-containing protein [Halolamina sp.]